MASLKRTISATSGSPSVNLYCAQCETQIGIFENEWIRLTSSYARSKEKGTHFGTEVGQRTQVVPGGPSPRTAEGCEMAEVFCRKCSNMVGQYCKKVPDASKQFLVDQYFYKLSRTFLKNSQTNARVEPLFGYSPDALESTPGARLSTGPRPSMTPTSRWMNTPLREASRTPSVQTATRSALRTHSIVPLQYEKPSSYPSRGTDKHVEASQQAMDILKQELAAQSSMLREHSITLSDQASQALEHTACLRDHDARMEEQDNCSRAQASRILEQDNIIREQRRTIKSHEGQLAILSARLSSLQRSVDNLDSPVEEVISNSLVQQSSKTGHIDFVGSFESLVRAMKEAQTTTQEVQILREQNQGLRSRLDSMLGTVDALENVDADDEEPNRLISSGTQTLGKRKRDTSDNRTSSLRTAESPATKERRLVRFDEQSLTRLPTPQSLQSGVSPVQDQGMIASTQLNPSGENDHMDIENQGAVHEEHAEDTLHQIDKDSKQQNTIIQAVSSPDEAMEDHKALDSLQAVEPSADHTTGSVPFLAQHSSASRSFGETVYSRMSAVDVNETLQTASDLKNRRTTRASSKATRREIVTNEQGKAESAHIVQETVGGLEAFDASGLEHSSDKNQDQTHLPSVQLAGEVLGVNLEPLQNLHQAFVATSDSHQQVDSTALPQAVSTNVPSASSGTLQSSFGVQDTPPRSDEAVNAQTHGRPATTVIATSQAIETPNAILVEDQSMFDNNIDFSDDNNDGLDAVQVRSVPIVRDPNRRVTDTWASRDQRSMAPEPSKRRDTVSNAAPKYVTLDRIRLATPQTWADDVSKGTGPRLVRPPPINRRELDLHEELNMLGLAEWIPRSKKSKEYRDLVDAARTRYRNTRLAEVLREKGLNHDHAGAIYPSVPPEEVPDFTSHALSKPILSLLDNPRVTLAPQININSGDENSQTSQSALDKANEVQNEERQEHREMPRMTRARARRSSASLDARLEDPEQLLQSPSADIEPSGDKRKINGRTIRQRKSDPQSYVIAGPGASQSAAETQEKVTSTSEKASEVASEADEQQPLPPPKQGRGRPRRSQGPVVMVVSDVHPSQEYATAVEAPSESSAVDSLSLPRHLPPSIPFPPERQKLLESMRKRALQREEAIAARDLLAKRAMEAMERESL